MTGELQLSDQNFVKLRAIIYDQTGISIGDGRKSLLISRLRSRLRETGMPDFRDYIARVTTDPGEMQELIDRVTTNKTYFYRTPRIWAHFRDVAVEEFLAKKPSRPMRIWSAAASTGEEAHTAGIVLEDVRKKTPKFEYKIVGSDISARVLKTAEAGVYEAPALAQFRKERPDLFQHHVKADDAGSFQINPDVKARISFKRTTFRKRSRMPAISTLSFCATCSSISRPEDQEAILTNVRASMAPDGVLYIGESESLTRLNVAFDIADPMVYRPAAGGIGPAA